MAILCPNCQKQYDVTLFQFGKGVVCDCGAEVRPFEPAPVKIPIDGTLDLHTFKPSEAKDLVPEYLKACLEKGIFRVRIVHGKGSGALLRTLSMTPPSARTTFDDFIISLKSLMR